MLNLYEHQQKIIDEDKPKSGIWLGCGGGKTRVVLLLAKGKTLVICPKMTRDDKTWEREVKKIQVDEPNFSINLTVMSKEEFRRDYESVGHFDTLIIDEAHMALGATPNTKHVNKEEVPKTSQIFEAIQSYIEREKPERIYPVTASIINNPMSVWAASQILGFDWDFYKFRETFYKSYRIPMKYFDIWQVRKEDAVKERLANAVKKLGYVGRLSDWYDVPDQTFRDVYVELTKEQKQRIKNIRIEYPEPITQFQKIHQIENGILVGNEFRADESFPNEKIMKILEYSEEFPQLILFVKFTKQIENIKWELEKKGKTVLTLTGQTKPSDRAELIKKAESLKECIVIVQAQISYGWELPTYPCIIFVSRTYNYTDYEQGQGRIQRGHNLKKNLYINLIAKPEKIKFNGESVNLNESDHAIHECLLNKGDFSEKLYTKNI